MRATVMYGAGDIRVEDRPDPSILEPSDAVVRTVAACVCGSDLWRYRGIAEVAAPTPIGHEYVGIVESVGDEVTTIRPGEFVVGYPTQIATPDTTASEKGANHKPGPRSTSGPSWTSDGSYMVFRRLRQDVPGFHRLLDEGCRPPSRLSCSCVGGTTVESDDISEALDDMLFAGGKLNVKLLGGAQEVVDG